MKQSDTTTEIEGKVLDVDPLAVVRKLQELGAKYESTMHFERCVCDTIPVTESRWVRLRTDGSKTTLSVKEIADDSVTGTSEWEVTVSSYDDMLTILQKMGISPRSRQENYRVLFTYKDAEVSVDLWPQLKPYVEIETKTDETHIYAIAEELGFDKDQVIGTNTQGLYEAVGIDIKTTPVVAFESEPAVIGDIKKLVG